MTRVRTKTELSGFNRTVLFVLPLLAALGPYLLPFELAGQTAFAFRVCVAILFVRVILGPGWRHIFENRLTRAYVVTMLVWIAWGAASLLWTPDVKYGVLEVVGIVFALAVGVICLAVTAETLAIVANQLRRGWTLAFLGAGAIAVWEITTGLHLNSSYTAESAPGEEFVQSSAGQPNSYGAFLSLSTSMLLWSLASARNVRSRVFFLATLVAAGVLIWLTASRISLFAFLLQLATVGYLHRGRGKKWTALLLILAGAGIYWGASQLDRTTAKLADTVTGPDSFDSSTVARIDMLVNGAGLLWDTAGLGTGAGGFRAAILQGRGWRMVRNRESLTSDPHAALFEIGSQYGLVILAAALMLVWKCATAFRQALRVGGLNHDRQLIAMAGAGLAGTAGLMMTSFASSTFLPVSFNWMFVSTLMAMAAACDAASRKLSRRVVRRAQTFAEAGYVTC